MNLADKVNQDLADIDSRILFLKDKARAEVAALLEKKAVLLKIQSLLTPELEAAVAALQTQGFLREV